MVITGSIRPNENDRHTGKYDLQSTVPIFRIIIHIYNILSPDATVQYTYS